MTDKMVLIADGDTRSEKFHKLRRREPPLPVCSQLVWQVDPDAISLTERQVAVERGKTACSRCWGGPQW